MNLWEKYNLVVRNVVFCLFLVLSPLNLFAIDGKLIGRWINDYGRIAIVFRNDKVFIYPEMVDDEINEFLGSDHNEPYELYINDNGISAGKLEGGNTHWGCRIDVSFHLLSNNVLLLTIKNYYYADDWETYFEKEHVFLLTRD
jgi:hypothetical protein